MLNVTRARLNGNQSELHVKDLLKFVTLLLSSKDPSLRANLNRQHRSEGPWQLIKSNSEVPPASEQSQL